MDKEQYNSLIVNEQEMIGYIAALETHEMIYITDAMMKLYGLKSRQDYRGKKCYQLLQGLDSPCSFCSSFRLKLGEKYSWEHYNDKLRRWMAVEDTLVDIDGRLCRLEVARDITEQKNKLSRLSAQLSIEETLVKCVETLVHESDLENAVNHFLEIIGQYYEADRSYIFEFDPEKEIVVNTFEWCANGITRQIQNLQTVPIDCVSDWVCKFKTTGEFFISSLQEELDHNALDYHILKAQGIDSLAAVPFVKEGEITGFLGIDNPARNLKNRVLLHSVINFIMEELEKRRLIRQLEFASYVDLLTGLKNRNQYIKCLEAYNGRTVESIGIIYVDINGLKAVNDRYGHKAGDALIVRTAQILREHMGEQVFRIGGDEFVVLCEGIDREAFRQKEAGLRQAFRNQKDCDVSVGSIWKADCALVEEEVMQADAKMYTEKQVYYNRLSGQS